MSPPKTKKVQVKQEPLSTSVHLDDPSLPLGPFEPNLTSTPLPPADVYRGGDQHWDHFAFTTRQMRKDYLLTDYTILAGDEKFPAHRAVLAAFSGLVRDRALGGDDSVLDLRNLNPRVVPPLLDFIYEGETRVDKDLVDELLAVAERMQIFGLGAAAKVDHADGLEGSKEKKGKSNGRKRKSSGSGSSTTTSQPAEKKKKFIATEDIQRFPKKEKEFIKSDDGKQYVCAYCYADFGSFNGVKNHVQLHTGEAKKFQCFRCEYDSLTKSNLKRHCSKKHGIDGKVFDTIMRSEEENNNRGDDEAVAGPSGVKQEAIEEEEEAPTESQGLELFKREL